MDDDPVAGGDLAAREVASVAQPVLSRLGRELRRHASGGMPPSQLSALAVVERRGPLTLGQLARAEGVAPHTMTVIVRRLEECGLLERRVNPDDRRSCIVATTAAGSTAIARARVLSRAYLEDRISQLDLADRRLLLTAVPILQRLFDEAL